MNIRQNSTIAVLLALFVFSGAPSVRASTNDPPVVSSEDLLSGQATTPFAGLSPGAVEVAGILKVTPLLGKLRSLAPAERGEAGAPMSTLALGLREEISEAVLGTSLEVEGVVAEIDKEVSQISEVRAYLESRRDRALSISTVANLIAGGGIGAVGSTLQLRQGTNRAGTASAASAGTASLVLSLLGLRQQHGGKLALGITPNMLAKLFDRTPEFHSDYPEEVWTYLNGVPPAEPEGQTRRQLLVKRWKELGRLELEETTKGGQKIEFLTSGRSLQRHQTISLLADRAAMLLDVRAEVALMKRDLGKLMLALRE